MWLIETVSVNKCHLSNVKCQLLHLKWNHRQWLYMAPACWHYFKGSSSIESLPSSLLGMKEWSSVGDSRGCGQRFKFPSVLSCFWFSDRNDTKPVKNLSFHYCQLLYSFEKTDRMWKRIIKAVYVAFIVGSFYLWHVQGYFYAWCWCV